MPSLRLQRHELRAPAPAGVRAPGGEQLPPPAAGYSYEDAAITAWLDAQVAAYEIEDVQRQRDAVILRLGKATEWFEAHDATDSRYTRSCALRAELEDQERWLRMQHWLRRRRCWVACCNAYVALAYVPAGAAVLADAPATVTSPRDLWCALHGERTPPGEWPPAKGEEYVRYRIGQIEVWNRDELATLLVRRKRKAVR